MQREIVTLLLFAIGPACAVEPAALPGAPASLEGTEIDGRLRTDASGEILFDEECRLAFDYFLTAAGELDPAGLDDWVARSIAQRLSGPAAASALEAWHAYSDYRREAARVIEEGADDAEQRLLATLESHLGRYPIARAERARITRAFAKERTTAADVRFAASPAGRFLAARQAVALARALGATPQAVHAIRTRELGVEAADRLRALDARRAKWDRRLRDFRSAREQLEARSWSSASDREQATRALETAHFSKSELRRVRALDRLRSEAR